jgi:hypothetical protein
VILSSNLPRPGTAPVRLPGTVLVAAVDVEWSKNYRIRGGNVPFCYSITWLAFPGGGRQPHRVPATFWYSCRYVHETAETQDLAVQASLALEGVLRDADVVTGHQLSSDLAVLASAIPEPSAGIAAARAAWHQRRNPSPDKPRIIDTRYDTGHVLTCRSRRLVDVCADLGLDVTQPELRGTSMTALHRRWLEHQDVAAREKITVLNLRHSLSTAFVAARAGGLGNWPVPLNVNRLLADELAGAYGWLASPRFTALLTGSDAA